MASVESTERVILKKRRERWNGLPARIKHEISKGVDRVREIRRDILSTAAVAELPPIHVIDVAWVTDDSAGTIHGRTTVLQHAGHSEYGAELAAPVVIHASDDALRGILLHEYAHCFHYIRAVLECIARGENHSDFRSDPSLLVDDEWDRKMMDPPELWFSKADVAIFPYHHSNLLSDATQAIVQEWILKRLPTVTPNPSFSAHQLSIPESIAEHIQRNPIQRDE